MRSVLKRGAGTDQASAVRDARPCLAQAVRRVHCEAILGHAERGDGRKVVKPPVWDSPHLASGLFAL